MTRTALVMTKRPIVSRGTGCRVWAETVIEKLGEHGVITCGSGQLGSVLAQNLRIDWSHAFW